MTFRDFTALMKSCVLKFYFLKVFKSEALLALVRIPLTHGMLLSSVPVIVPGSVKLHTWWYLNLQKTFAIEIFQSIEESNDPLRFTRSWQTPACNCFILCQWFLVTARVFRFTVKHLNKC